MAHRGFETLSKEEHKAQSSKGGKSSHAQGKAHRWTSEEARAAGRKGGLEFGRRRRGEKVKPNDDPVLV